MNMLVVITVIAQHLFLKIKTKKRLCSRDQKSCRVCTEKLHEEKKVVHDLFIVQRCTEKLRKEEKVVHSLYIYVSFCYRCSIICDTIMKTTRDKTLYVFTLHCHQNNDSH